MWIGPTESDERLATQMEVYRLRYESNLIAQRLLDMAGGLDALREAECRRAAALERFLAGRGRVLRSRRYGHRRARAVVR